MKTERWRQIEELYHAALDREPEERHDFLQAACADEEVRGEVVSLLQREEEAENFLEAPALEVTAEAFAEGRERSMFGRMLGNYEIVSFLGAGGMGEVYRARDSRIGRDVAIKLIPPAVSGDPERLRRFEQEARAAGALNHPNILAIYDVGVQDRALYVVYELLEGETLRDRLGEGALPRRKAIEYARQIAAGLAAAHDKGITHRDLKPENLFLTRDGRIKILDFGLAKLMLQDPAGNEASLATLSPLREPGRILGTPGYMAPEQLRGAVVDHRSDIFNLGAILYEMLTGQRPFKGGSTNEVLNAILNDDPIETSQTEGKFDPPLARLLRRCLEKNPYERIQSALDLAFDLETLSLPNETVRPRRWTRRDIGIGLAAATLTPLAAFFAGRKLESLRQHPNPPFHRLTYRSGVITGARFAPDGQTILYSAGWEGKPVEVFSTRVGGPESRALGLSATGLLAVSSAGELAVSLGCDELNWAECEGTLARMPLAGGAPREVVEDVFYADWAPDGKTLAVVRRVDGRFRLEYPINKVLYETDGWITYPRFSPKGDRIAFLDLPTVGDDSGSVSLVDLSGHKTTLTAGLWKNMKGLAWSPTGNEVWFSGDRTARAQLVHAVTLAGKERAVLQGPSWMRLQDISRDGRALLLGGIPRSRTVWHSIDTSEQRDLSWFDWSTAADVSADGKRLLFYEWGEGVGGNPTVYIRDTGGGDAVRLGEGKALALSPNGKLALALRGTPPRLVLLPTGPGEEKILPASGLMEYYSAAWFPDGKRILFIAAGSDRVSHVYIQDLDGGQARTITGETVKTALISPDGRFLALGGEGVYQLRPVDGGPPRPVRGAVDGDELIQWSSDGRYLVVRRPVDSWPIEFFRVDLSTGSRESWKSVESSDPVGFIGFQLASIHMTPDGRSFVYTYWKVLTELYLVDSVN